MTLKHSQFKALIRSLDALTDDQLTDLDALVRGLITARAAPEPEPQSSGPATRRKTKRRDGGEFYEVKMVGKYGPYRYRRWYEGGKLRMEYIGKA